MACLTLTNVKITYATTHVDIHTLFRYKWVNVEHTTTRKYKYVINNKITVVQGLVFATQKVCAPYKVHLNDIDVLLAVVTNKSIVMPINLHVLVKCT